MRFACSRGFLTTAERMVWTPSLSRDRKWQYNGVYDVWRRLHSAPSVSLLCYAWRISGKIFQQTKTCCTVHEISVVENAIRNTRKTLIWNSTCLAAECWMNADSAIRWIVNRIRKFWNKTWHDIQLHLSVGVINIQPYRAIRTDLCTGFNNNCFRIFLLSVF